MFWDFYSGQAIRIGDWKLWRNSATTVLFNIAKDPAELTNLIWQHPERANAMSKALDQWTASLPENARYNPQGRAHHDSVFAGAPANTLPDPRYLLPYDNPKPTPYPAEVISPGSPKPDAWQIEQPKVSTPAPSKMPVRRSQDDFFKARDRNQDGSITLEEFIGNPKGRNVPVLTTRFAKLDANSDGKLTLPELKSSP